MLKVCSVDDCTNTHRAKGLCSTHYNRAHQPDRHHKVEVACGWCSAPCLKATARGFARRYCSDACKGAHYSATRSTFCRFPMDYPAVVLRRLLREEESAARTAAKANDPLLLARKAQIAELMLPRECDDCGLVYSPGTTVQRYCSLRCTRRVGRRQRRATEHGALGTYTWTEVVHLWLSIDRTCAYCHEHTDDMEPDHVQPLSRGGSNSITNIVPSCHACNASKGARSLGEWADYRQAKGLQPLPVDPRLTHLTTTIRLAA